MAENMTTSPTPEAEGFWNRIIAILSCIVVVAVAFLILGPRPDLGGSLDVSSLPFVNMALNATTTVLLLVAFAFIKARRITAHKMTMLAAFGASSAFLVSYVIYHWFKAGPKSYTGDFTSLYYFILISHIILAALIIPLALLTLYRGWTDNLKLHKKIAKITLPLWFYVSVTGVVIYLMLY